MNPAQWWLYGGLGVAAIILAREASGTETPPPTPDDNGRNLELDLLRFEGEGGPPLPADPPL